MTDETPQSAREVNWVYKLFFLLGTSQCLAVKMDNNQKKDGISLEVEHPAFMRQRDDGLGFQFVPMQFVERKLRLYLASCIGEVDMHPRVAEQYVRYVKLREEER